MKEIKPSEHTQKEAVYFKKVSFNDDFDMVADVGGKEILYLKLVRNIVEISDEQELKDSELNHKPTGKGRKADEEKEKEIERLKGLIKQLYTMYNREVMFPDKLERYYEQFKKANNL